MKRVMLLVSAAVLLLASGCGGKEAAEIDLEALYADGAEGCGWAAEEMADIEGELLDAYYPGLRDIGLEQLVAKVPAMSSDVNEIVLLECAAEDNAKEAAEILQARIDAQVQDGAWYAETLEAWQNAEVIQQGNFAAMIASSDHQSDWESRVQEALS